MNDILANNYRSLVEAVSEKALRCGRSADDITIIAVTKGISSEGIATLSDLGCKDFGENRIAEALLKQAESPQGLSWHFIGSFQKNKVRKIVGNFSLIHSVDSYSLAEKISSVSQEANLTASILLQVNTSGEISKHGLNELQWLQELEKLFLLPHIELKGLMTMAPKEAGDKQIRSCFAALRRFQQKLIAEAGGKQPFSHLSMGMSNDYSIAIEEGATLLRIGSAIFNS